MRRRCAPAADARGDLAGLRCQACGRRDRAAASLSAGRSRAYLCVAPVYRWSNDRDFLRMTIEVGCLSAAAHRDDIYLGPPIVATTGRPVGAGEFLCAAPTIVLGG